MTREYPPSELTPDERFLELVDLLAQGLEKWHTRRKRFAEQSAEFSDHGLELSDKTVLSVHER